MADEQRGDEVRLVLALQDGEGNAVPVWGAWDAGITEEETQRLLACATGWRAPMPDDYSGARKLRAAFNPDSGGHDA